MGAATCVTERAGMRLGVMVRTAAELWVYWTNADVQALRVLDVTGRTPS
ncbi:MAG: hypothetical protein JWN15_643, partial [Firmicutes bacterium]|nr:hypothetical protein [Bacillota bacterium]